MVDFAKINAIDAAAKKKCQELIDRGQLNFEDRNAFIQGARFGYMLAVHGISSSERLRKRSRS